MARRIRNIREIYARGYFVSSDSFSLFIYFFRSYYDANLSIVKLRKIVVIEIDQLSYSSSYLVLSVDHFNKVSTFMGRRSWQSLAAKAQTVRPSRGEHSREVKFSWNSHSDNRLER